MAFLKQNKLLLGAAVLGVCALLYYFVFAADTTPPLTETDMGAETLVTQELLVTLSSLRSIELSNAIFTEPLFLSLTDFGVVIPQEPVGRRNPFLPYAGGGQTTSSIKPLNVR